MSSNTNALLPLTKKEVEQIISENMPDYLSKRFEVLFNDIPFSHEDYEKDEDEDASDFKEDDGREFRWFIIKDLKTNIEHCFNYVSYPDERFSFSHLFEVPKTINIVEKSSLDRPKKKVIYPKNHGAPSVESKSEQSLATAEVETDADLLDPVSQYNKIKSSCRIVDVKEDLPITKEEIDSVLNMLKRKGGYTIKDLRQVVFSIAVKYHLEEASLWRWLQVKRGAWKA